MEFVKINDERAPIRVLCQLGPIADAELAEFLEGEAEFLERAARAGKSWVAVVDVRRFEGATASQREALQEWLIEHALILCQTTAGVAFVCEPEIDGHIAMLTALLGRASIPTALMRDLDGALDWALQQTYDMEEVADPELVLNGIGAFRPLMPPPSHCGPSSASSSSWSMSFD